jgi:hypothetical protein
MDQQHPHSNLIDEEDDDDDDDDDEFLVDPILSGMAAFAGSCGTYVVKEPLGLVVLPHDPNKSHTTNDSFIVKQQRHRHEADEKKEQDDDLLLSVSSSGITATESLVGDDLEESSRNREMIVSSIAETNREPFSVQEGQKVQVVGVTEEGVYQLARGVGYIVATVNQLVKGT